MRHVNRFALLPVITAADLLAACGDATAPTVDEVLAHRASWSAQHLSDYTYIYESTGFLINTAGKEIRIDVRDGVVVSAVFAASGEPVPGSPTQFPTIDRLFDQAFQAAQSHALESITFDQALGYPRRIDLAGPPDASGTLLATQLEPGA